MTTKSIGATHVAGVALLRRAMRLTSGVLSRRAVRVAVAALLRCATRVASGALSRRAVRVGSAALLRCAMRVTSGALPRRGMRAGVGALSGCAALAVGVLTLLAAPVWSDTPARRLLTADDLYRVQDVSEPQVSPDGQWVAYVVTTNDRDADEARSAIWMVSWDGTQHVALTAPAEGIGKPRWSPDGRYLAYLSAPDDADKSQIMLLDRRGGEARPLPGAVGDIGDYAWSPDGKHLALTMDKSGASGKSPKPIVIEARHFKQDGEGYLAVGHARHLFLLDVQSGQLDALTDDAQFHDLPTWSPDGKRILFTRSLGLGTGPDGRSDLDLIEARPGATARTLAQPFTPNRQRLAWSPDGTLVTYLQGLPPKFNAYMQDHLVGLAAGGGTPRELAPGLDRAVSSYAFDGGGITATVEDDGISYVARVDLTGGGVTRATPAERSVITQVSAAAGHTALLVASDSALNEVFALEDGKLRKLSGHNDALLAELNLGAVEDIQFKSRGGTEIHGLIVKPPSYVPGRKYPTVLWIHGGPNGQDEHALAIDGYQFEHQLFAAEGFVVLRVNYRGSSGRGIAFAETIVGDWGHHEVEDLLAGVDSLVARGIADPQRLAIGGWSYGGILTDYTIASDRRFKAAISGAGSANQISMYGSDEYVLQYDNELGPPWRSEALWLKLSYPFFHADRIHTPTLFLGGEKDFNVPVAGGEQMYEALKEQGVPAQLVVYPGQHHVLTRPSFIKDLEERTSMWLDRYVPQH